MGGKSDTTLRPWTLDSCGSEGTYALSCDDLPIFGKPGTWEEFANSLREERRSVRHCQAEYCSPNCEYFCPSALLQKVHPHLLAEARSGSLQSVRSKKVSSPWVWTLSMSEPSVTIARSASASMSEASLFSKIESPKISFERVLSITVLVS